MLLEVLDYPHDVHGSNDVGVESLQHVFGLALQDAFFEHDPGVVDQHVEAPTPQLGADLAGALLNAAQVGGVCQRGER